MDNEQPQEEQEIQEFERMKTAWYQSEPVQFEIIKNLQFRETCFINTISKEKAIRYVKANAIRYLMMNFSRYKFLENTYNLYGSLALFPNMPMFSFNSKEKANEQKFFNENYMEFIKGYDFLLDIDSQNIELAYLESHKIKQIFDKFKVIYSLKFSGKKGFHFEVKYSDFPQWLKVKSFHELESLFKLFGERFAIFNNFPCVDYTIFDLRRICKTPYSIVYPYYFIALPLSDDDFDNFSLEKVSLPYWFPKIDKIRNRGMLKRQGDIDGFGNLIKQYTKEVEKVNATNVSTNKSA